MISVFPAADAIEDRSVEASGHSQKWWSLPGFCALQTPQGLPSQEMMLSLHDLLRRATYFLLAEHSQVSVLRAFNMSPEMQDLY